MRTSTPRIRSLLAGGVIAALTLGLVALGAAPAFAAPVTRQIDVAIDVTNGDLTFDSGVVEPHGATEVTGFDERVLTDGVALRARLTTDDFFTDPLVSARWRIIEDGSPTQWWIGLEPLESGYYPGSCTISREEGGTLTPVDLASDSPYSCVLLSGDPSDDSEARLHTLQIGSQVWSSLSGSVAGEGAVSLDSGHMESQNERFWVSGSRVTPDFAPAPIQVGERTEWRGEMRNSEGGEVGSDRGARMDFWYRIVNGGVPTDFWVKGWQLIYPEGVHYNRDYECEIWKGAPYGDGSSALPLAPFECAMYADESGYFDDHLEVRFAVRERPVTTISALTHRQQAQDLITDACTSEEAMASSCFYVAESKESVYHDPQVLIGPADNDTGVNHPYTYKRVHSRNLGWSITVTSKTAFKISDFVQTELWIALGHSGSVTDTVELDVPLIVEPGRRGWATWEPAYVRVHGDFFVEVDGELFRIDDMWSDVADLAAGAEGGRIRTWTEALPVGSTTTPPSAAAPVPAKSSLTHANKALIRPHVDTATRGQRVRVLVGLEHAGTWVSPSLVAGGHALGWHRVDATGHIEVVVPHAVAIGPEALAISTVDGAVIGWHELVVAHPPVAGSLAAAGQPSPAPMLLAALLLVLGGGALVAWRSVSGRTGGGAAD